MKTLIVVDMQNDFIDGSLGTKEAQAIVPNVQAKIKEYIARGDRVIFTQDTHGENYLQTNEGRNLPVEHCISGTHGWMIREEIDVPGCDHIRKPTFGFMGWNETYTFDDDIEMVGLCTGICVISNALILKAMFPDIRISVASDCCACVTPESHAAALQTMKMCQINDLMRLLEAYRSGAVLENHKA